MASNKRIESEIDNNYIIDSKQAMKMIKSFFQEQLSFFDLTKEYLNSWGHWGIEYGFNNSNVSIHSDRGFLDITVIKNGIPISLREIDSIIEFIETSSEKNILIILHAIELVFHAYKNLSKT